MGVGQKQIAWCGGRWVKGKGVGQKQIAWYGGRWVKGKGGGAETNSLVWWKVGERQGGWGRNK